MAEEKIKAAEAAATIFVRTDVSRYEDYEALAGQAYDTFGAVHLLCNNAGVAVAVTRPIWACTIDDWRWITGVNYWGVVHGIRAFVPRMLEGGQEGHIVNTSSSAGLLSGPALGPYKATKHGVLSMTETLANDLITAGSKLRASALCPSFVATGLRNSGRNRPGALSDGVQHGGGAGGRGPHERGVQGTRHTPRPGRGHPVRCYQRRQALCLHGRQPQRNSKQTSRRDTGRGPAGTIGSIALTRR